MSSSGVCSREFVGLQARDIFLTWDLEVILFILVFPSFLPLFLVTGTVFLFFGLCYGLFIVSAMPVTTASAFLAGTALLS